MKRLLLTTSLVLSAAAAHADGHESMGQGFDMLTTALTNDFERMGIEVETLDDLTIGQLAAIKAVLEDDDEGNDKGQVEAIIANN